MKKIAVAAYSLLMLGSCGQNDGGIADADAIEPSAIGPAHVSGKSEAAKSDKSASRSVRSASGGFAETRWCRAERITDARMKPDVPADERERAGIALELLQKQMKDPSAKIPWFCINVEDGRNPPAGLFWGGPESLCDDQKFNITGNRARFEGSCHFDKNDKSSFPVMVDGHFTPNAFLATPTWDHGNIAITYEMKLVIRERGMDLTDQSTAWQ